MPGASGAPTGGGPPGPQTTTPGAQADQTPPEGTQHQDHTTRTQQTLGHTGPLRQDHHCGWHHSPASARRIPAAAD